MNRFFHIFLFLWGLIYVLTYNNLFSQEVASGYIKDGVTKKSISGANIIILEQKSGTSADQNGFFSINHITSWEHHLQVSHLNYIDTILSLVNFKDKEIIIYLYADSIRISSVVITATRTNKVIDEIPQRVNVITQENLESYPATNTDNLLKMVPGLVVNRSWGIFSRNAAVTMRGMPGSSRSLIMLDGVPLNKSAGGTVNWHLITPEEIERIEIVKGPGSALYGNNAMGGVINIITKKSQNNLEGFVDIGYGSYNTIKSQLNLSGRNYKDSRGFFWKLGGFYRQGDGYVLEPEETRDSTSVEAYLHEGNMNAQFGYQFNELQKLTFNYRFYNDKRGTGIQVYEEDGGFESFVNNNFHLGYKDQLGKYSLNAKAFFLNEKYIKQDEKVNNSGEYKLSDIETDKNDFGLWMSVSRSIGSAHQFTSGIDFKFSTLDNQEIYRTTSDQLFTKGNLLFAGLFVQDDIDLIESKLKLIAGLRVDFAWFYNGHLKVIDPTDQTGFPETMETTFPESSWFEVSPKISAKYFISKSLNTFLSLSTGFMPPRLDDLVGSRRIRKGFKEANPELKPETLSSIEWGVDWNYHKKVFVKPSVFYSLGNDFQYLVATGEYLDSNSEDPVAVYQRQNISNVEVAGFELGLEYFIVKNINFVASYAYSYSKILEYNSYDDVDLTGNYLNEVPENLVFLGFNWRNRFVNVFIDYNFTDDQWYDEENTEIIEAYSLINVRFAKTIKNRVTLTLDIQDLLNERFIDRKGYLSPGRFIMFDLKYFINQ